MNQALNSSKNEYGLIPEEILQLVISETKTPYFLNACSPQFLSSVRSWVQEFIVVPAANIRTHYGMEAGLMTTLKEKDWEDDSSLLDDVEEVVIKKEENMKKKRAKAINYDGSARCKTVSLTIFFSFLITMADSKLLHPQRC